MKYSNLINPGELLDKENVVIIRITPDFPNYKTFSDIDIIGLDLKGFKNRVWAKFAKKYRASGFHIREEVTPNHCHLDFFPPGFKQLDLMFDLMKDFNCYSSLGINPDYYGLVIDRAEIIERAGYKVRIPCKTDDLVLRYLEYRLKPHKKKHLKYVKENKNKDFELYLNQYTGIKSDV